MTSSGDTWFAIAVRDATDLWLYFEMKRSHKSDVYIFWPYPHQEEQHVSYHKDGRWYATSYSHLTGGHWQQKPDATLVGSERVLTTPIHFRGVLAPNKPCDGNSHCQCATSSLRFSDKKRHLPRRPGQFSVSVLR